MKKLLLTICLISCISSHLRANALPAISDIFTIDTRDQENLPQSSNLFVLDTQAARALNSAFVALGDMNVDGVHTLEDLVILSQYAEGQGTPTLEEILRGDLDENGQLEPADVLILRDIVVGTASLQDVHIQLGSFAIEEIVGELIPGTLVEIWLNGDSSDFVQYVQFGELSARVIGWPDEHRVVVRVPNVPAGITNLTAYGKGWATDPYLVVISSALATSELPGAVAAEFFASLGELLEYFRTDALVEMQSAGLIAAGSESSLFELEVGHLEALVGLSSTLLANMPADERAMVDALLVANGFPEVIEDIPPPEEEDVSNYDLFYFLASMDELSAKLGRSHQSVSAMASYLVEKTEMKSTGLTTNEEPILLAALVLNGLQIFIDHTLPTDLTRLRAEFTDGVDQIDDSTDKAIRFIGDLRNERPDRRPSLGQALSGALAHFHWAPNLQKLLLEAQLATTSIQELDDLEVSMLGGFADSRSSAWAYNVELPIAFHAIGEADPDLQQRWPVKPPVTIPFYQRYTSSPDVEDGSGELSDLATYDVVSGELSADSTLGNAVLDFNAFTWQAFGTGVSGDSFVGYQRPILLDDAVQVASRWDDFAPPASAPSDEQPILPLSFSVVNSASAGSETPISAIVSLTNGAVAADVSDMQSLLDATPTLEIAIPALPDTISVNDTIDIPVYIRDTAHPLAAYDLLFYYNTADTELVDIAAAPGQVFNSDYFFTQEQNALGSNRVAGWTPNPVNAGHFVHAFTLTIKVLDNSAGHQIAFRARGALSSSNQTLFANSDQLTLDAGSQIGGLPSWRGSFSDWAHAMGLPDDPELTDPRYGNQQILAYALGWNPADSRTWNTQTIEGSGASFTIEFTRRAGLPEDMVELEVSENLDQWDIYTAQLPVVDSTEDPEFELVTYTIPIDPESLAQFFRLFVQDL